MSFHEDKPDLFGEWMSKHNRDVEHNGVDAVVEKFKIIDAKAGGRIYSDTSHGFIKGWGVVADRLGLISPENCKLIKSMRKSVDLVMSFVGSECVPDITFFGRNFLLPIESSKNILQLNWDIFVKAFELVGCSRIAYDLVLTSWYVMEIEERIEQFLYGKGYDVFSIDIDDLQDEVIDGLLKFCDIDDVLVESVSRDKVNNKKKAIGVDRNMAERVYWLVEESLRGIRDGC
jgi:hypothetical protein